MKPVQLKMARVAVGWGVRELAEAAGVTANTVTRIENGKDAKQSTLDALQQALEGRGAVFSNSNGEIGVSFSEKSLRKNGLEVIKTVEITAPDKDTD
jgi:transcriptional regulator with XRE-family HTH domain